MGEASKNPCCVGVRVRVQDGDLQITPGRFRKNQLGSRPPCLQKFAPTRRKRASSELNLRVLDPTMLRSSLGLDGGFITLGAIVNAVCLQTRQNLGKRAALLTP